MKCPHCGRKVKDRASTCSHCGRSLKVAREERKILSVGILMIVIVLIVGTLALRLVTRNAGGTFLTGKPQNADSTAQRQAAAQAAEEAAASISTDESTGAGTIGGEAEAAADQTGDEAEESEEEKAEEEPVQEAPLTGELTEDKAIIDLSGYAKAGVASAEATSTVPSLDGSDIYMPKSAVDGEEWSSWQEGAAGAGEGEVLTIHLDREYSVKYLLLKLGSWQSESNYLENYRPQTMTITAGDESFQITFPDEMKEHCVTFSKDVKTDVISLRIDSAYSGTSYSETCITEVEVDGY